jgi:WD40 repeat protein
VKVWNVASGQIARDLQGHNGNVFGTAFSTNGTLLASSGDDGMVRLWDIETGRELRSLRHGGEGLAVAFSPDGTLLASGSYDHQVYVWGIPIESQ